MLGSRRNFEDGKMPEGEEKDIHTVACLGIATQDRKMPSGIWKTRIKHVTAGEDGDVCKKAPMPEGILKNTSVVPGM